MIELRIYRDLCRDRLYFALMRYDIGRGLSYTARLSRNESYAGWGAYSVEWDEFKAGSDYKPIFSISAIDIGGSMGLESICKSLVQSIKDLGYGELLVSQDAGELGAVKEHLSDMRRLVFHNLEKRER